MGEMLTTGNCCHSIVNGDVSADCLNSQKQELLVDSRVTIKRIALDENNSQELMQMYQNLLLDCDIASVVRLCDSHSRVNQKLHV